MRMLISWRENTCQRNQEIDGQERILDAKRLVAACIGAGQRRHFRVANRIKGLFVVNSGEHAVGIIGSRLFAIAGHPNVVAVTRHLIHVQLLAVLAACAT